jgi:DNA-binding NtrC family response regulator
VAQRVIAVVKDLLFVARIRETARLVGAGLSFARTPGELVTALESEKPSLVIIDLTTTGWDYEAFFGGIEKKAPGVPLLGFTTHALARETQPLHARCARVVTKETLAQELPTILKEGMAA